MVAASNAGVSRAWPRIRSKIRNQTATTTAPRMPAIAPSMMIRVLECSIYQLVTHKIRTRQPSRTRPHHVQLRHCRCGQNRNVAVLALLPPVEDEGEDDHQVGAL